MQLTKLNQMVGSELKSVRDDIRKLDLRRNELVDVEKRLATFHETLGGKKAVDAGPSISTDGATKPSHSKAASSNGKATKPNAKKDRTREIQSLRAKLRPRTADGRKMLASSARNYPQASATMKRRNPHLVARLKQLGAT